MPAKYSEQFKTRALQLLDDRLNAEDRPSVYKAIQEIGPKLGIAAETLRRWFNQQQIDSGKRSGVTSDAEKEIRRLKRENTELRRANEILKTASAFFAAELDRPSTK